MMISFRLALLASQPCDLPHHNKSKPIDAFGGLHFADA
jgi:hypothetical protein